MCITFLYTLTDGNELSGQRNISQVQSVSPSFENHEWYLKSNEAAHTVVYVRHPEPTP
jgi:hypothetical protein